MREMRRIYEFSLEQLTRNVDGLVRLCKWLGIYPVDPPNRVSTYVDPYRLACLYKRWCQRNPQPRVDKR